ncbi:MAG: YcxB family protein [Cyanobacteria bacterium SZAS LIN-3]|nr:YcxB family protein [Cyanobacteria bacterium SZAS LIN-3]
MDRDLVTDDFSPGEDPAVQPPAPLADELTVTNTLTFKDMLFCNSMPFHPAGRVVFLSFICVLLTIFITGGRGLAAEFWPIFLLQALAIGAIIPLNSYYFLRKNKDRFTDQHIAIGPAGIYSKVKTEASSLIAWRKVVAIKRRHGAIIIQVSKGPAMYFWITQKSFADPQEYDRFYRRALDLWQAAQLDVHNELVNYDAASPARDENLTDYHRVQAHLTLSESIKGNWARRGGLVSMLALVVFMLAVASSFLEYSPITYSAFLYGSAVFLLALLPLQSWIIYRRHPEWMSGLIAISPEHLVSRGCGYDGMVPWKSVKKVERKYKLIILHLKSNWSIIIPQHCFASTVDADIFFDDASRYCAAANLALPRAK